MGLRELEVMVLSAQNLKNVKLLGVMDPYCVAWLTPHSKVSGPVNKGGGVHPTWNAVITLVVEDALLNQGDAAITVEIYSHGTVSNKLIGYASVPLADVQGSSKAGTGSCRVSTYLVQKKSGKYRGVINVQVKAGKPLSDAEVATRSATPSMGVPQYAHQLQQQPRRDGSFGGAGAGLGAGLLGGLLLGSALDSGGGCGGGDTCKGGGCGGCGGDCGGGGCGG